LSETTLLPEQAPTISAIAIDAAVAKRTILEPLVLTGDNLDIYTTVAVANPELTGAMVDD
jgi:hypothetical protein